MSNLNGSHCIRGSFHSIENKKLNLEDSEIKLYFSDQWQDYKWKATKWRRTRSQKKMAEKIKRKHNFCDVCLFRRKICMYLVFLCCVCYLTWLFWFSFVANWILLNYSIFWQFRYSVYAGFYLSSRIARNCLTPTDAH